MNQKISMASADLLERLERHGVLQALPSTSSLSSDKIELWFDPRHVDVIGPVARRVAAEHGLRADLRLDPSGLGVKLWTQLPSFGADHATNPGVPFSVYAAMALTAAATTLGRLLKSAVAK